MSDYPMLISNKLHSFRNFRIRYNEDKYICFSYICRLKYHFLAYDDFYFVCQDNDGSF